MEERRTPCPGAGSPRAANLPAHLDTLLERYLNQLDAYTELRIQLSNQLSSAFFSLAQAQRSSALPPGRRYGEEMYDARMKAVRWVEIEESGEEEEEVEGKDSPDEVGASQTTTKQATALPTLHPSPAGDIPHTPHLSPPLRYRYRISASPPHHLAPEIATEATSQSVSIPKPSSSSTLSTSLPKSLPTNPLRQFGILTPPPLRTCSTTMTSLVSSTIPSLLNTSLAMAELETEIWDARANLGFVSESDRRADGGRMVGEVQGQGSYTNENPSNEENDEKDTEANLPAPITLTSPEPRNLPSRTKVAEPRSRVLKLGS